MTERKTTPSEKLERNRKMFQLRESGASFAEVAYRFGVCENQARYQYRQHVRRGDVLAKQDHREKERQRLTTALADCVRLGATCAEAARKYDVTVERVRSACRDRGVRPQKRYIFQEHFDDWHREWKQGVPLDDVVGNCPRKKGAFLRYLGRIGAQ